MLREFSKKYKTYIFSHYDSLEYVLLTHTYMYIYGYIDYGVVFGFFFAKI